jgi:hypothetical protein
MNIRLSIGLSMSIGSAIFFGLIRMLVTMSKGTQDRYSDNTPSRSDI